MARSFEQYFADYAEAFNRFDADRIASFFHCPCLLVSTTSTTLLPTPGAIHANTETLLTYHRAQGFGRASVRNLRARTLGLNLALVEAEWRVERTDGTVLWTFRNTYNLGDFGDGWKILVSTTHGDTRSPGHLEPPARNR